MLKVNFKNQPSIEVKETIHNYWLIENNEFKYPLSKIGQHVYSLLKRYCDTYIVTNCSICNKVSKKIKIENRNIFEKYFRYYYENINYCTECEEDQKLPYKLLFSFNDTQNSKSDIMIPEKDIILKAGEKYLIKTWNQADGRFNISISDKRSLMNQKKQIDDELDFLKESE